ncbi:hypothetical protein SO802_026565 [Lithocarpus litseifolius]|uniref:Uncharacterized protein n=1 Tax=Lithocarpus litseifolius TaxID=425828 RepID=A0AAW2BZW6_9ROSI
MQTAVEESNENPRITDGVDTENLGLVTDSMQADAELDANQADVEEHNSGAVFSKPNIQPLLNGLPDLNMLTAKEVNSDNRDAVQVESRSEVLPEQGPHKNHPSMDGAGLSNLKPKSTWTRFNRMEFGFGGLAHAITLPTLRKRDMRDDVSELIDGNDNKRGKVINKEGVLDDLSAGVDSHPCRKQ